MSDSCTRDTGELSAFARIINRVVVVPAENEIFLDIDSQAAESLFLVLWPIFEKELFPGAVYRSAPSPSGWSIEPRERILLQALLGSDTKHELLSLVNLERGSKFPTVFFELNAPRVVEATGELVIP